MTVWITNRQTKHPLPLRKIQKKAQAALNALASPEAELSLLLTDDEEIAALNRQYLDRSGPTNVIAFPMGEGEFVQVSPGLLGDVVVSVDTAAREAAAAGIGTEERFIQLLIHGILHLFGYDHEHSEKEAAVMEEKTMELLALIADI